MLLAATGIEFTREEALEELRGGGWVWVAPEGSKFGSALGYAEGLSDWQDLMQWARLSLGEDVAYVGGDESGWFACEAHANVNCQTPEEALSAAQYGDLRQWFMVQALKEGP